MAGIEPHSWFYQNTKAVEKLAESCPYIFLQSKAMELGKIITSEHVYSISKQKLRSNGQNENFTLRTLAAIFVYHTFLQHCGLPWLIKNRNTWYYFTFCRQFDLRLCSQSSNRNVGFRAISIEVSRESFSNTHCVSSWRPGSPKR